MKTMPILIIALTLVLAWALSGCSDNRLTVLQARVDSLNAELKKVADEKALTGMRLVRFDSLDFDVYSNQKWDAFSISHDDNIKVYYPDGAVTVGLNPQHLDMLRPLFAFAPDTKIDTHPVKFGSGDWTAVISEMHGTFSKPMAIGGGKSIRPTGKKFQLAMATIGHWSGGKMIEEYLFWDNQAMMKQIGLAK